MKGEMDEEVSAGDDWDPPWITDEEYLEMLCEPVES